MQRERYVGLVFMGRDEDKLMDEWIVVVVAAAVAVEMEMGGVGCDEWFIQRTTIINDDRPKRKNRTSYKKKGRQKRYYCTVV